MCTDVYNTGSPASPGGGGSPLDASARPPGEHGLRLAGRRDPGAVRKKVIKVKVMPVRCFLRETAVVKRAAAFFQPQCMVERVVVGRRIECCIVCIFIIYTFCVLCRFLPDFWGGFSAAFFFAVEGVLILFFVLLGEKCVGCVPRPLQQSCNY